MNRINLIGITSPLHQTLVISEGFFFLLENLLELLDFGLLILQFSCQFHCHVLSII